MFGKTKANAIKSIGFYELRCRPFLRVYSIMQLYLVVFDYLFQRIAISCYERFKSFKEKKIAPVYVLKIEEMIKT